MCCLAFYVFNTHRRTCYAYAYIALEAVLLRSSIVVWARYYYEPFAASQVDETKFTVMGMMAVVCAKEAARGSFYRPSR